MTSLLHGVRLDTLYKCDRCGAARASGSGLAKTTLPKALVHQSNQHGMTAHRKCLHFQCGRFSSQHRRVYDRPRSVPGASTIRRLATAQESKKRQKIPDICEREDVRHVTFNEFLRSEGITN